MPKRIARPCRTHGCGSTTTDRQGYCDTHKPTESSWSKWQRRSGNRHQRGYGSKWDKLRKVILSRDFGLCQICLKAGRTSEASHVDHIRPKSQGGTDAEENLQSLCKPCHDHKTATERRGGGSQISTA